MADNGNRVPDQRLFEAVGIGAIVILVPDSQGAAVDDHVDLRISPIAGIVGLDPPLPPHDAIAKSRAIVAYTVKGRFVNMFKKAKQPDSIKKKKLLIC